MLAELQLPVVEQQAQEQAQAQQLGARNQN